MFVRPRFFLIIGFVMLVVLSACGGSTNGTTSSPTSTPAETPAISGTPPGASTETTGISPTSTTAFPEATLEGEPTGETEPTDTPTRTPAAKLATLEMRVTDAPPEGVSKILITVENIQVNVAGGETAGVQTEGGWQTIIEDPRSFDLVALTGVEGVLGSTELPPGRYNQVRMDVVEALITIEGEEVPATIPSGVLRLVGGFELAADDTTILTLDFDAARSVVLRGMMDPLLKPAVKLLVRRGGQSLEEADEVGEAVEDGVTPVPSPGASPTLEATATSQPDPPSDGTATPAPTATPTQGPVSTTITLNPSKDNTLFEDEDGLLSNGAGRGFIAGKTNGGHIRRGLIEFDIAGSLPQGATITNVTLTLRLARTSGPAQDVSLHQVSQEWGEGASIATSGQGAASAAGDATWIHTIFSTTLWDNPGGGFESAASSSTEVGVLGDEANYVWGSTSALVEDVQEWLDDDSSNHGWLLMGNETTNQTTKLFDTRESTTADNRPVLTVTFLR